MSVAHKHFSPAARFLHWLMAPLVIAMLFIGVGMVATLSSWHQTLLAIFQILDVGNLRIQLDDLFLQQVVLFVLRVGPGGVQHLAAADSFFRAEVKP